MSDAASKRGELLIKDLEFARDIMNDTRSFNLAGFNDPDFREIIGPLLNNDFDKDEIKDNFRNILKDIKNRCQNIGGDIDDIEGSVDILLEEIK